jgi:hypothetical protein
MSDENPRRPLTFSQAQGFDPLPSPLALGELSQHARVDLWNWMYSWANDGIDYDMISGDALQVYREFYLEILHRPRDEFSYRWSDTFEKLKMVFLQGAFNRVFDTVQFFVRTPFLSTDPENMEIVRRIFRRNLLAYDILDIPPDGPTIVPNASPEEGEAIREAFANLATGPFDGARHHLQQAAHFINTGDAPKAVAQTMHAVESVVRVIAPNNNFKQALTTLNAKTAMHPALSIALDKLYGYTSDEKGIRHPLLESDVAKVHMPEAVFMYGACASFITYLISRARESGLLDR